ncbi:MAG: hypothetical protein JKX81_14180 [Arenicella sp.]|nr:hypothetical protein [Arenicella sp.]
MVNTEAPKDNAPVRLAEKVQKSESEEPEADPFLGREMQAQFLQVADLYKQNSRYPVGSIPVVGERFAQPIKPFEQAEVDTPYPRDKDDTDPIRISASLEKMEYFAGEAILARVLVSGGEVDEYSRIEAFGSVVGVSDGRDTGLNVNFERVSFNEFRSVIDTQAVPSGQIPREALLALTLKLEDGRSLSQTVPFFYNGAPSARVENVLNSRQDGAFLFIPLQYSVFESGYYFVDAILDDAATGQPLVQLQTEGRMQLGNGLLTLKAHIHALMDAGSPGPYTLRVVSSFRAGTLSETRDVAATVSRPLGYYVQGAPFDQYEDTPFVDPEVQERIEFLEQIGGEGKSDAAETRQGSEEKLKM